IIGFAKGANPLRAVGKILLHAQKTGRNGYASSRGAPAAGGDLIDLCWYADDEDGDRRESRLGAFVIGFTDQELELFRKRYGSLTEPRFLACVREVQSRLGFREMT